MSNDLRKLADANYYFGEIKLWLDARTNHNLGLIIEGKSDEKLFAKLFNEDIMFFPVDGCYNVIDIIEKIDDLKYQGIIAIIDTDFRRILGEHRSLNGLIFVSDHHDLEMMIIDSLAWNEVLNYFCTKSKRTDFEEAVGINLQNYILELIKPIASIRYLNVINEWKLIFKTITNGKCNFIDYKSFIDNGDLSLDLNQLLIAIENKSQKHGFFSKNGKYKDDIEHTMSINFDLWEFCNGHDFLNVLSIALENVISDKRSSNKVSHFDLEEAFIIAFSFQEFMKTRLYNSLNNWEQTSEYKIF